MIVIYILFIKFNIKISVVLALVGGDVAPEPTLTLARIINFAVNRSIIQVPILDEFLEDAPHARTGKIHVSGFTFKSYYHATMDSSYFSEDRGTVIMFQISLSDGTFQSVTAGPNITNRALDV